MRTYSERTLLRVLYLERLRKALEVRYTRERDLFPAGVWLFDRICASTFWQCRHLGVEREARGLLAVARARALEDARPTSSSDAITAETAARRGA